MLFLLFKLYGSKWSILAKFINGRTDNSIKNHWNSIMRRKLKKYEKKYKSEMKEPRTYPSENMTFEEELFFKLQQKREGLEYNDFQFESLNVQKQCDRNNESVLKEPLIQDKRQSTQATHKFVQEKIPYPSI